VVAGVLEGSNNNCDGFRFDYTDLGTWMSCFLGIALYVVTCPMSIKLINSGLEHKRVPNHVAASPFRLGRFIVESYIRHIRGRARPIAKAWLVVNNLGTRGKVSSFAQGTSPCFHGTKKRPLVAWSLPTCASSILLPLPPHAAACLSSCPEYLSTCAQPSAPSLYICL